MQLKVFRIPFATLLAMKLLILLITVACLQANARVYSQKVTLVLQNASLEQAFQEIKKQTGYSFIYTRMQLKKAQKISCKIYNMPLKEALDFCFNKQPVAYVIERNYIIIQDKHISAVSTVDTLPDISFSGRILNERGEPIAGASVTATVSGRTTSSNAMGEFLFRHMPENESFLVTCIGFKPVTLNPQGRNNIIIHLVQAMDVLDESIIMGYGKTSRRFNTGNISKVSAAIIERQPVSNPIAALQGRVPGLLIATTNGLAGGDFKVLIRGQGSIAAGTRPLFVVDGVPFHSSPLNNGADFININGGISPLNSIDPDDIESMEVLKDADATAIYGSRGANGVILITTKSGQSGKMKLDVNLQQGFSRVARFSEPLSLRDYLSIRKEGFRNDQVEPDIFSAPDLLSWDTTRYTNWEKYLFGHTAPLFNVSSSISGGNEWVKYQLRGHYRKEGTILPDDRLNYQRYGISANIQMLSANKRFSTTFNTLLNKDDNRLIKDINAVSLTRLPLNFPLLDESGAFNYVGTSSNPGALLKQPAFSKSSNNLYHLTLQYKLLKGLSLKTALGYNTLDLDQVVNMPASSQNPIFGPTNNSYFSKNKQATYIIEPQLNYDGFLGKVKVDFMLGGTWQFNERIAESIEGINYSNESLLGNLGAAGAIGYKSNSNITYKYLSQFSRLGFIHANRYLLNLSFRRDGSSRFGPGNRFGNFGAVGAGWIFSESRLVKEKLPFLNFAKLRASYGLTGNDQIADYEYLPAYRNGALYQSVASLVPARLANDQYGWEKTSKLDLGIEASLWKDQLFVQVSWFQNRSDNQLVPYTVPAITGFTSYLANLPAVVSNKGWEFEMRWNPPAAGKWTYYSAANLTIPENELRSFPGLAQSSYANTYVVGEELSIMRLLSVDGVNPQTGVMEYGDTNKDGLITYPQDYQYVARLAPELYGGWSVGCSWKGLALDIFLQGVKQHSMANFPVIGSILNPGVRALERWKTEGDITTVPAASANYGSPGFTAQTLINYSNAAYLNSSYVRLKNLNLSYTLAPGTKKRNQLVKTRLYIEGQNILTFTARSGRNIDPETANWLNYAVPVLKTWVAGINITL